MNTKKSLLLLLMVVFVFSCKQDELLDENTETADLTTDTSLYDNSYLGSYKGTFTTLDAAKRGIVEVKILANVPSKATLTLVSGVTYYFKSLTVASGQDVTNLRFTSDDGATSNTSFNLSVNADGGNPRITNVIFGGSASDILILKETSRGPITSINGSWTCTSRVCLPGMQGVGPHGTFNVNGTTGGVLTTQITLNMAMYTGTATQEAATNVGGGFEMANIVNGTAPVPQPSGTDVDINFSGSHTWRTGPPDCSTISGGWTYQSPSEPREISGSFHSDLSCPNNIPGDIPSDPLPITPGSEGDGCSSANTLADLTVLSGFTDSGVVSACDDGMRDIWYSWTATTDGLTFFAKNTASSRVPGVSVWDVTGTTELDCGNGSRGAISLSGWTIGDPVLIRISADILIPFCIEEFSLPVVPANDTCATAEAIVTPLPATVMGNTASATDSDGLNGKDVWYTFDGATQAAGDQITVSLCGSSFDTWLGIYSSCGGTLVADNEDFNVVGCASQSQVTFINDGTTNYVIKIDGSGTGDSGAFTMNITSYTPAGLVCGGTIIDSGGVLGNYGPNEDVTYVVDAGPGMAATVDFVTFDLDIFNGTGYDYMRFYDGPDTNAPRITTSADGTVTEGPTNPFDSMGFSGTSLLGKSIEASGQFLTVTFFSDPDFEFAGYEGNISCRVPLTGDTGSILTSAQNNKVAIRTEAEIKAQMKARQAQIEASQGRMVEVQR